MESHWGHDKAAIETLIQWLAPRHANSHVFPQKIDRQIIPY